MSENNNSFQIDAASFRDPSGFVYQENGKLLRQVNQEYRDNLEMLMDSGLYTALTERNLLITHKEVQGAQPANSGIHKILEPERIPYISYPYEWCFSQLKDAALLTLRIQKLSLEHGMTLKDASAYNVQFIGASPVFIDTLSFEPFQGKPWVAYKQFCQHFLGPLALISKCDYRLIKLLANYIDGIPLDLVCKILPRKTKLNLGLLTHLHLHAGSQKKYADQGREKETTKKVEKILFTPEKAIALIDHLTSTVAGLQWKLTDTEWGAYYSDTNYDSASLGEKAETIVKFCESLPDYCEIYQDLGANDGKFGRAIAGLAKQVICHDIDEVAVEKNYLAARQAKDEVILPLVQDLSNPSADIGWANQERRGFPWRANVDVTIALALIHHIAISNNVPLEKIAAFFATLSRYLIIEFVEKTDSQVQRLLATREDIFSEYSIESFERAFSSHFIILQKHPISNTERTMYLLESHSVSRQRAEQ